MHPATRVTHAPSATKEKRRKRKRKKKKEEDEGDGANSKHWFTTSFLQPLPYLVTPQGPENCQLTSSFLLLFCWCSNSSRFVTNNSNKTRRVIYSRQQSLHQHKQNHNRLNRDGTLFFFFFFTRGGCVSCLRACFGARLLLQSY